MKILKDFESKDPEKYEKYISTTKNMGQLNDFWVDNIYFVEQWMKNKRPDIDFEKMFPAVQDLHLFDKIIFYDNIFFVFDKFIFLN